MNKNSPYIKAPEHADLLLTPGPVPIPPFIAQSLSEPIMHHRTPRFKSILLECRELLKIPFGTEGETLILGSSGTGAMEAACVNFLNPGDHALVIVSGKFGERWAAILERFGVNVTVLDTPWGKSIDLKALAYHLAQNSAISAVFTQACETSTGELHPVSKIGEITRSASSDPLLIVDGITAIGAMPFHMDNWGVDIAIAGSQKAFMLPTGLSMIALSRHAQKKMLSSPKTAYYFNLLTELASQKEGQTAFSSPTSLIYALNIMLQKMQTVTWNKLYSRIAAVGPKFSRTLDSWGFPPFPENPSPSLSVVQVQGATALRNILEKDHAVIAMEGQGPLKNKVLRFGHMGYQPDVFWEEALCRMAKAWGKPYKEGDFTKNLAPWPIVD